ncbi:fatty acid synthase alpha subunit Lsd1, partial [Coemansia sp. RSA 2704]
MTYAEVIGRAVELMYVRHQQRWTSPSYTQFVLDFVDRVERRMCIAVPDTPLSPELRDVDPLSFVERVVEAYPESATQLLTSEDVQYFIDLCKRRGQKPPPFIPVLDADFGVLFLKGTTSLSDHLDAVIDQDPQRVGIQQGPVAAKYSTVVDEPVKDILDSIYHGHIAALVERQHGGDASSIPVVEFIGAEPATVNLPANVSVQESATARVFSLSSDAEQLPDLDAWLPVLAGPHKSWLRALLTTPTIVQSGKYVDNYVRRMLRARPGQKVTAQLEGGLPSLLTITDSAGIVELMFGCDAYGAIRLTVYHTTLTGIVVQLPIELSYVPSQCLTPIHGSKQQEDKAVQHFSIDTWVANASEPTTFEDVADSGALVKSNFNITEDHSRRFCESVGNQSWQYAYSSDGVLKAPMDFAYVAFSRDFLRLLQSSVFGSGQLSVVHLYNDTRMEDGARLFQVGDELEIATVIEGLTNVDPGKKITLLCTISCKGQRIATIWSSFLSRSHYIDTANAFEHHRQQHISIVLPSAAEVAVLESKEWFVYRKAATARLAPGTPIEFCLDSEYRFKSSRVYASIVTTGSVTVQGQGGARIHLADVDFKWGTATQNPVLEFLNRFTAPSTLRQFEDGGYALTTAANAKLTQVRVPKSNVGYAVNSRDGNPFHLNPYIADYVDLPGTITHGLWTSASTRAIVENIAAGGRPERIRAYRTEFTGMVFPTDQLTTELFHVGMTNGRMLVKGQTAKVGGGPVMDLTAEIDQPLTAYVFTGQGSQEAGMGMALYEQSAAARDVWDRANAHMLATYDIDLLDLVRTNPKELTVYFVGVEGERIRRNYMALMKHASNQTISADAGAAAESSLVPIIPEITAQSASYTFRSPTGLLNATQFTQTSLVLVAMAAVADMRANGLVQTDAIFAGHSLGDYCALAALGNIFTIEGLLDITFYRGLIMQSAVPRDAQGRSEFGMAAVDPSRVGESFGEDALLRTIDAICNGSPGLLQVVNYNVRGQQYVASGTLINLAVLRLVLDEMAASGVPADADIESHVGQLVDYIMTEPVNTAPVRGVATIPLRGIDVPFHSRQLVDGVIEFRSALLTKINCDTVSPDMLYGRYVPNLTAVPFEVTSGYFEMVHAATGSAIADDILRNWSDDDLRNPAEKKRLAVVLLVELLSYQLAAPVQWIQTQDCLFNVLKVQRVVEIGPSPVLCGMAAKTLRDSAYAGSQVSLLHSERDRDEIYYVRTGEESEAANAPVVQEPSVEVFEAPST